MPAKNILIGASFTLALAVMIGAFGAHGLKNIATPAAMNTYQTGVTYHFYHAFGIFMLGGLAQIYPKIDFKNIVLFFALGIFLFSFNCYLYAITMKKVFAMIVPFGGVSFIVGWLLLGFKIKKEA